MYKQRIAALILLAPVFSGAASAQERSAFDFAEPPKKEEVAPQVIVPQNPELSERQRSEVGEMIKKTLAELSESTKQTSDNTAKIDGNEYVLLGTSDEYVGITSGMHVVYSTDKDDYFYFDSQQYRKVMTKQEFDLIKSHAQKRATSVVEKLMSEAGLNPNTTEDNTAQ